MAPGPVDTGQLVTQDQSFVNREKPEPEEARRKLVNRWQNRVKRAKRYWRVPFRRMRENMERSFGLMFSQRVLLRLAETGLPRQQAYEIVQRNAMRAWRERAPFRTFLAEDPEVTARLTAADLDACFDPTWYLRNVDAIYKRAGLS